LFSCLPQNGNDKQQFINKKRCLKTHFFWFTYYFS